MCIRQIFPKWLNIFQQLGATLFWSNKSNVFCINLILVQRVNCNSKRIRSRSLSMIWKWWDAIFVFFSVSLLCGLAFSSTTSCSRWISPHRTNFLALFFTMNIFRLSNYSWILSALENCLPSCSITMSPRNALSYFFPDSKYAEAVAQ